MGKVRGKREAAQMMHSNTAVFFETETTLTTSHSPSLSGSSLCQYALQPEAKLKLYSTFLHHNDAHH